jgi:hypothetical protein
MLRVALLVTLGPVFLYTRGGQVIGEVVAHEAVEGQKRPLLAAVTGAAGPGEIVLIDPDVEMQWLDFERRTRRPTLVMWKFAPTNDAELITWYRRMQFRQALFDQGCGSDADADIAFLLTTPAHAARLSASCGSEIYRGGQWVLLRHRAGGATDAVR